MTDPARQCYICLETEENGGWVTPCRCAGSLAWVHRGCMLRWVREHESSNPGTTTKCPQCLTTLILVPKKGPVVSTLELIDKKIYPFCKMTAFMVVGFITLDAECACLGVLTMVQVHGLEYVKTILMTENPIEKIAHLHLISYALIVVTYLPWEDCLLEILRKCSRLPVLGNILPSDAPNRFKIPPPKRSISRIIVSCIILPTCAKVCGDVFFRSIESNENRIIAGGLIYLAAKGILYMYYKQKLLNRRKYMTVLPYPAAVSSQTS